MLFLWISSVVVMLFAIVKDRLSDSAKNLLPGKRFPTVLGTISPDTEIHLIRATLKMFHLMSDPVLIGALFLYSTSKFFFATAFNISFYQGRTYAGRGSTTIPLKANRTTGIYRLGAYLVWVHFVTNFFFHFHCSTFSIHTFFQPRGWFSFFTGFLRALIRSFYPPCNIELKSAFLFSFVLFDIRHVGYFS